MHLIQLTHRTSLASPALNILRTQYPKNGGNTVHCRILVVYSSDHMAEEELQSPPQPSIMREYSTTYHQPKKEQNSKYGFY